MSRHEELLEHLAIGKRDEIGNAVQLGDLSRVLQGGAALTLNESAGACRKCVERGLKRTCEAGREIYDDSVAAVGDSFAGSICRAPATAGSEREQSYSWRRQQDAPCGRPRDRESEHEPIISGRE